MENLYVLMWVKGKIEKRSKQKLTIEEYQKFFDAFNPVDYNPREWARAAKDAGMKYAVMTAKHHDGFCLFDSEFTDYKATKTPAGRDLIKEYVEAFRAEGLKVGFYYSLLDWHHPDYPHYSDGPHPMSRNDAWKDKVKNASILEDGVEVYLGPFWAGHSQFNKEDDVFLNFGEAQPSTKEFIDNVVKLVLNENRDKQRQ